MRLQLIPLALLFAAVGGCVESASPLVWVTAEAATPLESVARLRVRWSMGGTDRDREIGGLGANLSFPMTFGVEVPPKLTAKFTLHVDALSEAGEVLASGDGSVDVTPGRRAELTVQLVGQHVEPNPDRNASDMGATDMGDTDAPDMRNSGATDMRAVGGADMLLPPPPPAQPGWIASGGSAATAGMRLNLTVGGSLTVGTTSAPSKAKFTGGFAAHQSH